MAARAALLFDLDELIRLRAEMFRSMGIEPEVERWRDAAEAYFERGLASASICVAVVDAPTPQGLVAMGVLQFWDRLASPKFPLGRGAYVSSVSVDPSARRQGHGRSVMEFLIDAARARGVERVELHASQEGEPLYVGLGFEHRGDAPEYRLTLAQWPPSP